MCYHILTLRARNCAPGRNRAVLARHAVGRVHGHGERLRVCGAVGGVAQNEPPRGDVGRRADTRASGCARHFVGGVLARGARFALRQAWLVCVGAFGARAAHATLAVEPGRAGEAAAIVVDGLGAVTAPAVQRAHAPRIAPGRSAAAVVAITTRTAGLPITTRARALRAHLRAAGAVVRAGDSHAETKRQNEERCTRSHEEHRAESLEFSARCAISAVRKERLINCVFY